MPLPWINSSDTCDHVSGFTTYTDALATSRRLYKKSSGRRPLRIRMHSLSSTSTPLWLVQNHRPPASSKTSTGGVHGPTADDLIFPKVRKATVIWFTSSERQSRTRSMKPYLVPVAAAAGAAAGALVPTAVPGRRGFFATSTPSAISTYRRSTKNTIGFLLNDQTSGLRIASVLHVIRVNRRAGAPDANTSALSSSTLKSKFRSSPLPDSKLSDIWLGWMFLMYVLRNDVT